MSKGKYVPSKNEIVSEIVKCGKSCEYFINTYVKASHPLEGLIPFKLYPFQKDVVNDFSNHRFNIILKSRQLGISTLIAAYAAWMMLFYREKNILVLATQYKTAANLVKKVKSMIKHLPEFICISKIKVDNSASFELDNFSQIKPSSSTTDAGRSEALSLLIVDEAAHVENLEEIWTAIYSTISTGGKCILSSSPSGVGTFFHKTYVNATNGSNDFHPIKLLWDVHPERDEEWFKKETRNMSERQIAQELMCSFQMSGETVFSGKDIERMKAIVKEPVHRTGFDRNYWIWKDYQPGKNYLISADVARGDGADFSVFHVFNIDTMEIVAEYQGKLPPDLFATVLYQAGKEYGNCLVVVENNTIGHTVITKLEEMLYPNIYYSTKHSHEYVESYEAEIRTNAVGGFSMSMKTRPLVIAKFEEYVRNKILTINSIRLVNEMNTFVWSNGRPEAMRGYNDDLIMACAIGCWVRDTAIIANQRDIEYRKAFLDCIVMNTTYVDVSCEKTMQNNMKEKLEEHKKMVSEFPWIFVK